MMKKIFLTLFIFFSLVSIVSAEVLPYYVNSLRRYGIGFTAVQSPVVLRQTPSEEAKTLETLNFDYNQNASCLVNKERCEIDEVFSVYSEDKKIALLTTLDETQDWSLVCFNQAINPICGWVDEKTNKYYNWSDFFNILGKKYGLYLFKDLKKADKILYSGPMKQTNATGSLEMPKSIHPWLVRGNWVLVKAIDFDKTHKTGWFNFRGEDNKLKMFVKF